MRVNPFSDERVAQLLRLLRPAPQDWVTNAQRTLSSMVIRDQREAAGRGLTEGDLAVLARELETDLKFRQRFDADPVAAAEAAGMHVVALRMEREIRELVALAERIANDDVYRFDLDADPVATLVAAGIPAVTAEPFLQALSVPDDVLAKLPEVVAHQHEKLPLEPRLLLLLLGSAAVVEKIRSASRGAPS